MINFDDPFQQPIEIIFMQIDKTLILKLEKLARLELTENERQEMVKDIQKILNMVDQLNELDTTGVEPLKYLSEYKMNPRTDEVIEGKDRDKALDLAPERIDYYISIPKVVDK
ncbi:MAG TPA: Asp-tRNA(Asn)/Glu-tRNA(Gln) amidotransferase subunit GatC [Saprospiraceae bacterium]|nr:Asp-tRNA(Asn)/Glu-tRNA(Gln) amidotransferase subunit GatC [Saprospiraceae bacterium]